MTLAGWIIMLVSVTSFTTFMIWCITKVLKTPGETDHLRGIEHITPDQKEDV